MTPEKRDAVRKRRICTLFWMAVGLFAVHAVTYAGMLPAANVYANTGSREALFFVGITFWLSGIFAWTLLLLANFLRRDWLRRNTMDLKMNQRLGVLTVFSNPLAVCADCAAVLSLIALGISALLGKINEPFTGVILAMISFSLNAHGLFNGRIYKSTRNQTHKERET